MKITRIEAVPFRVPLAETIHFATGQLAALEHVLVRVHTDEGAVGIAEAPARPMVYGESVKSIVAAIEDWFSPALSGLEHDCTEEAWRRMDRVEGNSCAKGGVDLALHDLIGQAAGMPLYRLLGHFQEHVDLCHILGIGSPAAIAEQAVAAVSRHGFLWLKLKAGLDPENDTRMIEAVRAAVGPGIRLTVDCNHGYTAAVAARTLPRWEPFDLAWVEEPCPGSDLVGRARVAAACTFPIMVDESAPSVAAVAAEAARGDCRVVSIKTARTGIAQSRRILHIAEANGLGVAVGSQGDCEVGTLGAAHFGAAFRATGTSCAELTFFLSATDRITQEPLQIRNGSLVLSATPGTGVRIDEGRLARLRLDR